MFTVEQLPAPEGFENVTPDNRNKFLRNFYNDLFWYPEKYSPLLEYASCWADVFCPEYDPDKDVTWPSVIPFCFFLSYFKYINYNFL